MKRINVPIFLTSLIISFLGLVTIFSTEISNTSLLSLDNIFIKQVIFVIIGIVISIFVSNLDYTLIKYKPIITAIYIVTIVLLILTDIFGQEVNGARRWLSVLGTPLQPSEFAKITVILVTAYIFNRENSQNEWINLLISFLLVLPIAILIYIEPHGSMALIMIFLWFVTAFLAMKDQVRNILVIFVVSTIFLGLFLLTAFGNFIFTLITLLGLIIGVFMFFARDNWRVPVTIGVVFALVFGATGSIIWNNILSDYQKERIVAFQNPTENASDSGFNVEQSKIAIGSGGVFGKGFANGSQSRLQFLPFHQTDFIFASYAEEFGLIGCIVLLVFYFLLLWNIFIFAVDFPEYRFEAIIVVVLGIKILIEVFINLGTNLGISPATGIPLPLMSAGGSITVMTFFSLGLIQGIIGRIKSYQAYVLKS